MNKNNWKFTRNQLIILSIMASIAIFVFTIDIYLIIELNNNETISSSVNELSSTSGGYSTASDFSTTSILITQPVSTMVLTPTLPQIFTPTIDSINQTPSSNPIVTSTQTSTPPPQFFTNEWDDNTNNWKWFSTSGNDNLWDVYNEAGVLVFSLLGKDTGAYFVYSPWIYDKVTISTQIEVRSKKKSTTIIICNYSEMNGWYEFNIGTDGLWEVRIHDSVGKTGYLSLISGGSLAIQTGEGINEYTATCNGNHLTLSINGTEVLDFTDTVKKYEQGKIGLGVLSYSQVPVLVESAWIKINQP